MSVDRELFGDRLPTYLSRFVGRERELAELQELCARARLVTICGVGGLGKTRLAIELARRLRSDPPSVRDFHEVFWVPLAAVTDPETVPEMLATGLGIASVSGSHVLLAVVNALRDRRALLVLDNCEQVATGCAQVVTGLLRPHLDVVVIATSRIPLGAIDEEVYAVPPLAEAVDLFVDRAMSMAPAYALTEHNADAIGEICDRLAGLPLAIELTASWVRTISPLDLLDQLGDATHLASAGGLVAARHRDLGAVLDSSWQWLSEPDQAVATALGVFRGGFTRDAAERVAGASLASLSTLTERSLIQRLPDATGGSRYEVHELIRTYALARLEASGSRLVDEVRSRHFDYFLAIAESMETPEHAQIEPTLESAIAREQANLDAALRWALDRGDAERALRIVDALHAFYPYSRPRNSDRVALLTRALAIPWTGSSRIADIARGRAVNRLGYDRIDEDPRNAEELFRAAIEVFTLIDDRVGLANSFRGLSWCALAAGKLDEFARWNRRSLLLAREGGDDQGEAWSLHANGIIHGLRGDLEKAVAAFDTAYAIFRRNRGYYGIYRNWFRLAEAWRRHRRWEEALEALRSAFDLGESHHFTTEGGDLLEALSLVAAGMRHAEDAARVAGASDMWRAVHDEKSRIHWPSGEADLVRMRKGLGEQAWQATYTEGLHLTGKGAVRLAYEVIEALLAALERPADLTYREIDVLRLVAEGLNNSDIAARLVLSPRTVHAHLRSIFAKLGVTTRTAAVHEAMRLNVV